MATMATRWKPDGYQMGRVKTKMATRWLPKIPNAIKATRYLPDGYQGFQMATLRLPDGYQGYQMAIRATRWLSLLKKERKKERNPKS
jgi:hypothetical protein